MIGLIGINHKTAPIEIRERFVFDEQSIISLANQFKTRLGFEGLFVLSTCNRTEFYFVFQNLYKEISFTELSAEIANFKNFEGDFDKYTFTLSNSEAIKHMFQVAAGLDSMILGEYQIVGQMKDAYFLARNNDILGPTLTRMFHKALETGKKIRTNTEVSRGALSVSYAAVKLADDLFANLNEKNVLVIGAGKTGQIAIEHFQKKGITNLTIANRTLEKAVVLAQKTSSRFIEIKNISEILHNQDIVLVSTACEHALITKSMMQNSMLLREQKSILLIDLSVPRNIEADIDEIEGVELIDMDRLQKVVEASQESRKAEIKHASVYIERGLIDFNEWLGFRELMPAISSLSENFKAIHQTEIELFLSKNNNKVKAEQFGEHITKKYIQLVIKQLKNVTNNGQNPELVPLVNKIFDVKC
ncbi:MAG: glutamyl-tRNA reductase [Bacteroidales bacterium]|jgi:glutamyl-tRNA reductase|nr:glutamyl-tRNA reductase [Bacteroidales bacterium]